MYPEDENTDRASGKSCLGGAMRGGIGECPTPRTARDIIHNQILELSEHILNLRCLLDALPVKLEPRADEALIRYLELKKV